MTSDSGWGAASKLRPRLFVISQNTKDYGDRLVVREHRAHWAAFEPLWVGGTLEEARGAIEEFVPSLVRIAPHEWDDSVIIESWGSQADADLIEQRAEMLRAGASG